MREGAVAGDRHVFNVRVYYEDTDAAGIVYYANYLKYAERARTEMLRDLGFENGPMMADAGVAFAVRRCTADYLRPAMLDDRLEVHTRVLAVGGASLEAEQTVRRGDADIARLRVRLACVTRAGRPGRLPGDLRRALALLCNGNGRD